MFTVTIDTDNEAFQGYDHGPGPEVARILRAIADKLEFRDGYDKHQTVFDANGNDVGRFRLTEAGR